MSSSECYIFDMNIYKTQVQTYTIWSYFVPFILVSKKKSITTYQWRDIERIIKLIPKYLCILSLYFTFRSWLVLYPRMNSSRFRNRISHHANSRISEAFHHFSATALTQYNCMNWYLCMPTALTTAQFPINHTNFGEFAWGHFPLSLLAGYGLERAEHWAH